MSLNVLQRWQNYTNIAPQILVEWLVVDRMCSEIKTNNQYRTTNNRE